MLYKFFHKYADLFGIASSVLCLIHCLLIPLFLLASSFVEQFWQHWELLDYFFIILAALAVYNATRHTYRRWIATALWISVLFFAAGILLHDVFTWARDISITASLLLIALHLINFRLGYNRKTVNA